MPGGVLDVVIPTSPAEAVTALGDGDGVTVLAGGTIVMPELTHGRLKPDKVLMLARSGLDTIERDGGTVTIGAACSVAALQELTSRLRPPHATSQTERSAHRRHSAEISVPAPEQTRLVATCRRR